MGQLTGVFACVLVRTSLHRAVYSSGSHVSIAVFRSLGDLSAKIEVKLVLAEMVMHLAETESMENLDTFMAGCIAKDAAHVQSGKQQFQILEAALAAKAVEMRDADRAEARLWYKQQKNANKMILDQVKGNRHNFQQATIDLEDKYTTIYQATVELAARIESNNVSRCPPKD